MAITGYQSKNNIVLVLLLDFIFTTHIFFNYGKLIISLFMVICYFISNIKVVTKLLIQFRFARDQDLMRLRDI